MQIAQKHPRRDYELQVFHIRVGLRDRRMVVEHQQDTRNHKDEERPEGQGAQIPGRAELQRPLPRLDRKQMQKNVLLHEQCPAKVAVAAPAPEDGAPNTVRAYLFDELVDRVGHGYTLTSCLMAMALERSTSRLPSSLSHMRNQGSGLGAGPSIFTPSLLNLLPWQGQAMMPRSGLYAVRQPRCVQMAERAKKPSAVRTT